MQNRIHINMPVTTLELQQRIDNLIQRVQHMYVVTSEISEDINQMRRALAHYDSVYTIICDEEDATE